MSKFQGGSASGQGTGGCDYNGGTKSYPCVPYGNDDFNSYPAECPNACGCIEDYGEPIQVIILTFFH